MRVEGLTREIAYLRILMDDRMQDEADPPDLAEIARALDSLTRAVRAQYGMSRGSHDSLAGAIAGVIEKVGGQLGLPEALGS